MSSPEPYSIHVSDAALEKLKRKLADTDYPDELDTEEQWRYGAPLSDVKRLAERWQNGFDWRKAEAELNEFPNYRNKIDVDGFGELDVHYVWQKSDNPNAIPLLFVHGWPGSFIEVKKILPLLKGGDGKPAFHIIAPSLPNFGFSQRIYKPGFALPHYAETCHKLMLSLGYDKYVTQGGDWGFYITRILGILYPDHVLASHINMIRASPPTFSSNPALAFQHALSPYSDKEKLGLQRSQWFREEGSGYRVLQATKPQTLSFAFADSPVALLAWIYEKLHDWTDAYPWTDDEILEWISIYQFSTAGPGASVRVYYERMHSQTEITKKGSEWNPAVKMGISCFPRDLYVLPKAHGRSLGPVVFEAFHESGGHFAAHERPEVLVADVKKMFGKGGGAYSVTKLFDSKL